MTQLNKVYDVKPLPIDPRWKQQLFTVYMIETKAIICFCTDEQEAHYITNLMNMDLQKQS